jgi:hypothetical protein
MKLIKCPKCQRNILDNTANCQYCGAPLSGFDMPINQEKKLKTVEAVKLGSIAAIIFGFILIFSRTSSMAGLLLIILYIIILSFRKNIGDRIASAKSK